MDTHSPESAPTGSQPSGIRRKPQAGKGGVLQSNSTAPTGIVLGTGATLVTEDFLFAQFAPFGYNRTTFRKLLKALHLPSLITPSGHRLLNLDYFILMAHVATRPGGLDLHPLSTRAAGDKIPSLPPPSTTIFSSMIEELIAYRKYKSLVSERNLRKQIQATVDRILNSLEQQDALLTTDV